jgi:AraC-like DNA-binding protein
MTRAIEVPDAPAAMVAVRFKPGTAAAIARCALSELTDREAGLDELAIGDGGLAARVAEAATPGARLGVLAGWLRERLAAAPRTPRPDRLVGRAVAALTAPGERAARIDELADELGVTRQHLARVFRREVGVTPKELVRIARVQRAVAALGGGARPARLAAELGYFDQAHLANEVRALVGATPAALAAERPLAMVHLFAPLAGPATPSARPVPFLQARARRAP